MVDLVQYREYWQGVVQRVPQIGSLVPVTVDQDISHYVSAIPASQYPILFMVVPEASGTGSNVDNYTDSNQAMVMVVDKYDAQRSQGAYNLLEQLQPIAELIKQALLADMAAGCPLLADIDVSSMRTVPVTSLYNILAGWIVQFTFQDSL